jgi:phosphoserine phosphatase RsbU/P
MIRELRTDDLASIRTWPELDGAGGPGRGLDCHAAIKTMRAMSTMTEPDDLVEIFTARVREVLQVDRALIINRRGLEYPEYQVETSKVWSEGAERFVDGVGTGNHSGGLLAGILYAGELGLIKDLATHVDDPAFDLLAAERSLLAFPLFEKGRVSAMVVLLSPLPSPCEHSELIALAVMTNLLDRAVQSHELTKELAKTCKALDLELQAAANVQQWLLPVDLPNVAGANLAVSYSPAKQCGGDYYGVAKLAEGKLGLFIADVSGKGAPAAVLVGVVRSFVELNKWLWTQPVHLLSELNQHLCHLGLSDHGGFVTAFCGVLDVAQGALTYASAGHPPPRLLRAVQQRQASSIEGEHGLPLGITEAIGYCEERVSVDVGDLLLLYTDGIVEAFSPSGEQFGVHRLDRVLLGLPSVARPEQAIEAVNHATREFCASRQLSDDQALVAVVLSAAGMR